MTKAIYISVAAMLAFVLLREVWFFPSPELIPNPDNAWLLYAAGRLAAGQKLYIDILETNPPLIVWLNLLPLYLGRLLSVNPLIMLPILVSALALYSLFLCSRILRDYKFQSEFIIYIAFGFFILSTMIYGQREHIFIILALPYLLTSLSKNSRYSLAIIMMAAIAFAIKPFFMLLWGINELARAVENRKISTIFAWHNWFIGLFQLAYFAAIYFITPEYFSVIIPALFTTYFAYETPLLNILKIIGYITAPVFLLLLLSKLRDCKNGANKLIPRAVLWMFACAMFMVLQQKIWINHQYPLLFMAGLVLLLLLTHLIEQWKILRLEIGRPKFAALAAIISIFIGALFVDVKTSYLMVSKPSKISEQLIEAINTNADGKYIYPLVYNMQPSFPAINLSKGVFLGGFHQLWAMAGLIIRDNDSFPAIDKTRKWFYDTLVDDFSKFPPQLVWVDENINLEKVNIYDISPADRDIIAVLSRDVRFAKIWQNYKKIGEIIGEQDKKNNDKKPEKYSLYIRKN